MNLNNYIREIEEEFGNLEDRGYPITIGANSAEVVKQFLTSKIKEAWERGNDKISLLDDYSKFLEKEGYLDTDWYVEKPTAIERYIGGKNGTIPKQNNLW